MKLENLQVRVEKGADVSEVFLTGQDPYINVAMHLPNDVVDGLETGMCEVTVEQTSTKAGPTSPGATFAPVAQNAEPAPQPNFNAPPLATPVKEAKK